MLNFNHIIVTNMGRFVNRQGGRRGESVEKLYFSVIPAEAGIQFI